MGEQALGRRLVLAEVPDAPEERQERREAALRARRHAVGPALLGNLRRVALGDGPGARRVHDQRAAAGDQPLVVGAIVPSGRIRRKEPGHPRIEFERLAHRVGLDRDVALGVDQCGAEGLEDGAGRIDRVRRRAEPDPEREAGLVAGLGGLEERVERPAVRLGRRAGRIHGLDVDAGDAASSGRCASRAP